MNKKPYRKRSNRRGSDDSPGHDAFLDIVANLVGILIILVVVVGTHAGASIVGASQESEATMEARKSESKQDLDVEKQKSHALLADNRQLRNIIENEHQFYLAAQEKRKELLIQLSEVESETKTQISELELKEQEQVQALQRSLELKSQLAEVERELTAIESDQSVSKKSIIHYPTPLAKTVFREEVHCRVLNGRVVWVPLNELVSEMRREWKLKSEKLKTADETVETVGPVGSFRLQYTLAGSDVEEITEAGRIQGRSIEFRRFVILPTRDGLGEMVGNALEPGSEFQRELERFDAKKTTVSIWVYSNSYDEFNQLKDFLRERGYETAVWPLGMGKLISGGPNGYRSTAQ